MFSFVPQACLQAVEKMCSGQASVEELQTLCSLFHIDIKLKKLLKNFLSCLRKDPVVPLLVTKDVAEVGFMKELFDEAEREESSEAILDESFTYPYVKKRLLDCLPCMCLNVNGIMYFCVQCHVKSHSCHHVG